MKAQKILLIGDGSNYHATLGEALAARGHEVAVASHGSRWMDTRRNIDISRRQGKLGGALLWLRLNTVLADRLKGYDIVQISNPIFVDLMPYRVRKIFDKIKRDNGAVFLTMLGTDSPYVRMCLDEAKPLRYSEFAIDGNPSPYAQQHSQIMRNWLAPMLSDHCDYIYQQVDGVVSALYEYHLSCSRFLPAEKLAYGGIPIALADAQRHDISADGKIRIMLACHKGREMEKGADAMLPVLQDLVAANKERVQFDFVQNVPLQQFKQLLDRADIVVDQLYSYTPATTALMAMARGKVVVSGGEEEYYDFIGENEMRPIINPNPMDLHQLQSDMQLLVDNPQRLRQLAEMGPRFVAKHNAADVVAARFEDFWQKRLGI